MSSPLEQMSALSRRGWRFARRVPGGVYRRSRRLASRLLRPAKVRILALLPERRIDGLPVSLIQYKKRGLARRRTFGPHDIERLERLLADADEVVPIREAFARRNDWPERFVALRHDMDNELENAVIFAEWEAERGYRATYYVLHTDWYYRQGKSGPPSRYVLRVLDRIASLGHEIGLHNNAVTAALQTGEDPIAILDRELGYLRRHGFDVVGSVAHGDPLCHQLGYVNNEVFAEMPQPKLGAPDRTLELVDIAAGQSRRVELQPIPMRDLGLEYEANQVGYTLYLSDTGGHWNRSFPDLARWFGQEGGYLQALVHPAWWALSGEEYRPRPSSEIVAAASDDGYTAPVELPPGFKVIIRGDCCCRRAIDMNADLFGGTPLVVKDEKSRTDFFVEHEVVGSPDQDDIRRYMNVDAMSNSLRQYALHQTDRDTLNVEDASLLAMDDYADMNFQAWRHRHHGWKLWMHPAFLHDKEAFERDFEKVGFLTFDESIERHIELITRYRARNGNIPVLYLHQPTAFYRKLDDRADYRRLGLELERSLPGVFFADLDDVALDPDDMGSCGPGQTLHFTKPTYRKMIEIAMNKGLSEWLQRGPTTIPS